MVKSSKKKNDSMPSLKEIREILNQAKFNPKEPGPLNIVAHSSGPSYLESRAMEFIMEAQQFRGDIGALGGLIQANNLDEDKERYIKSIEQYRKKMIRAVQCLTLAIIKVQNGEL